MEVVVGVMEALPYVAGCLGGLAKEIVSGAWDCLTLVHVSFPARNINKIINNAELPLGGEAQ